MSNKMENLKEKYALAVTTDVYFDGNFTIAIMKHKEKKFTVAGVAKRNANSDVYIKERGMEIAIARAFVNVDKAIHPRKYARLENKKVKGGS